MNPASVAAAGVAKVANTGVVKALLMPVASAYGEHWGQEAKARLKAASQAKRQENLKAHLSAARSELPEEAEIDPDLFQEWIDSVERVDPQDAELSAAWQAVLKAAATSSPYRAKMLDTVKRLSPDEAVQFINIRNLKDQYYVKRFRDMGLLKTPLEQIRSSFSLFLVSSLLWIPSIVYVFYITAPDLNPSGITPQIRATYTTFLASLSILWIIGSSLFIFQIIMRPSLTAFGKIFRSHIGHWTIATVGQQPKDPDQPKPRPRKR